MTDVTPWSVFRLQGLPVSYDQLAARLRPRMRQFGALEAANQIAQKMFLKDSCSTLDVHDPGPAA